MEEPDPDLSSGGTISRGHYRRGSAGSIKLVSVGTLTIEGGASITSSTSGAGNAGSIAVQAMHATITDSGRIDSGTSAGGRGGTIVLNFDDLLRLTHTGSISSDASGNAPGGNIIITSPDIDMGSGGTISASSTGSANAVAGSISITFADTLSMRGASITTQSSQADGGNISIVSTGSVLQLIGGELSTSVQASFGNGGNITLGSNAHPIDVVLLSNSQVLAQAVQGHGGDITVFADTYLSSGSIVDASSRESISGNVNINARITDLSDSLTQLPGDMLQAANLLRSQCQARVAEGKASSLVVAGREGTPPQPDGLLWSPLEGITSELSFAPEAPRGAALPLLPETWFVANCAR